MRGWSRVGCWACVEIVNISMIDICIEGIKNK